MNKQNTTAKYTQKSKEHKIQQNKTTLFESPTRLLRHSTRKRNGLLFYNVPEPRWSSFSENNDTNKVCVISYLIDHHHYHNYGI